MKWCLGFLLLPFSCYPNNLPPDNPTFHSAGFSEYFLSACSLLASWKTNDRIPDLDNVTIKNGMRFIRIQTSCKYVHFGDVVDREYSLCSLWHTIVFLTPPRVLESQLTPCFSLLPPIFEAALSSRMSGLDLLSQTAALLATALPNFSSSFPPTSFSLSFTDSWPLAILSPCCSAFCQSTPSWFGN